MGVGLEKEVQEPQIQEDNPIKPLHLTEICLYKRIFCGLGHDTREEHNSTLQRSSNCYECDGNNKKCPDYFPVPLLSR